MDFSYVAAPFIAWFVTGVLKFLVNYVREKRLAVDLVGCGGMPSNHASISSIPALWVSLCLEILGGRFAGI